MGLAVNQVIGNYECLGIIGKPKAGVTYKVRNLATGELEALRALPGASSRDPESVERLLREIRIQARLSHPNIISLHDAFELDGHRVMTTDFAEGPTLAELSSAGPLPLRDAVRIVTQVLNGLEEAHALQIVHRGISAEHVIVTSDGTVKLGGFDLAKTASDTNLTQVGATIGDSRYISPEQVAGRVLDGRADLYSAGVLLYQALTGKLPFEAESEFDALAAHVNSEPRPPSALNPAIPPGLDAIVLTALKKDPGERFQDANEFRAALAGVEIAIRVAHPGADGREPLRTPQVPPVTPKRPLTTWLVCGSFVVVIALAVISWVAMH